MSLIEEEKRILLQLITNQVDFLNHFAKYSHFINSIMMNNNKTSVYSEFTENGIVYSIKDAECFLILTTPIIDHPEIDFNPELKIIDKILLKILYPHSRFPKEGFTVLLYTTYRDQKFIYNRLTTYFQSISPNIQFKEIQNQGLEVFFPTYMEFMRYVNAFAVNFKIVSAKID